MIIFKSLGSIQKGVFLENTKTSLGPLCFQLARVNKYRKGGGKCKCVLVSYPVALTVALGVCGGWRRGLGAQGGRGPVVLGLGGRDGLVQCRATRLAHTPPHSAHQAAHVLRAVAVAAAIHTYHSFASSNKHCHHFKNFCILRVPDNCRFHDRYA